MADVNPFLKYVIKDEKEDIVHSSAYAKVQNGGAMGASSAQSFAERQRIEQNRQVVRGYNSSRIVSGAMSGGPRAKAYTPPAGAGASGARPIGARPMSKPLGVSPKR